MDQYTKKEILKNLTCDHEKMIESVVRLKKYWHDNSKPIDQKQVDQYTPDMSPEEILALLVKYYDSYLGEFSIEVDNRAKTISGTLGKKYRVTIYTTEYGAGFIVTKGKIRLCDIDCLDESTITIETL